MQADGETFEHFITEMKLLIKDCGYPNRGPHCVRHELPAGPRKAVKPGSRTNIR